MMTAVMRVLVVGGTEFISLALVRALIRDGHAVTVLNRGRKNDRLPAGVSVIPCDRKDHAALQSALAGARFDGVCDITYAPTTGEDVAALADALAGAPHVLFVSTGRVYDHALPIPFSEATPRGYYWGDYARHKIAGEDALLERQRSRGVPAPRARWLVPPVRPGGRPGRRAGGDARKPEGVRPGLQRHGRGVRHPGRLRRTDRRGPGPPRGIPPLRSGPPEALRQAGAGLRPEPRVRLPRRVHDLEGARRARDPPALPPRVGPPADLGVVQEGRFGPASPGLRLRGPAPRPAPAVTPRRVLVYHPDEAEAYARLVRAPRGAVRLDVCSAPQEAAAPIAEGGDLNARKIPPT